MTEPYYTEDQKMYKPAKVPSWSWEACNQIKDILYKKGYLVNTVSRVGCDRKAHHALQVRRENIPQLIEELFRQRMVVEVQAEGKGMASINFVYDYSAESVIDAVKKFRKNKLGGGKVL